MTKTQRIFIILLLNLFSLSQCYQDQSSQTFIGHKHLVSCLDYISSSERIVSGSWDKNLIVWDFKYLSKPIQYLQGHTNYVNSVKWIQQYDYIISGDNDGKIIIWDYKNITHQIFGYIQTTSYVINIQFDNDFIISGHGPCIPQLSSCSDANTIQIWNLKTLTLNQTLIGHTERVEYLSFLYNSKKLISISDDRTIRIWNITNGLQLQVFNQNSSVSSLLIIPSNKLEYFIIGTDYGYIMIYDYSNVIQPIQITYNNGNTAGRIMSLHYIDAIMKDRSQSPLFVAASTDQLIRVYNYLQFDGPIKVLSGHTGMIASIIYIEKYDIFISGAGDNAIKLWDATICKYYCDICSENNGFCFSCQRETRINNVSQLCSCIAGYGEIYQQNCVKCHESCETCNQQFQNSCTSCQINGTFRNDFSQINNTCPCGDGYFDNGSKICVSCPSNCQYCINSNQCTSCVQFTFLNSQNTCQQCYKDCYTCFGVNKDQCIICQPYSNRILINQTCICISGYKENDCQNCIKEIQINDLEQINDQIEEICDQQIIDSQSFLSHEQQLAILVITVIFAVILFFIIIFFLIIYKRRQNNYYKRIQLLENDHSKNQKNIMKNNINIDMEQLILIRDNKLNNSQTPFIKNQESKLMNNKTTIGQEQLITEEQLITNNKLNISKSPLIKNKESELKNFDIQKQGSKSIKNQEIQPKNSDIQEKQHIRNKTQHIKLKENNKILLKKKLLLEIKNQEIFETYYQYKQIIQLNKFDSINKEQQIGKNTYKCTFMNNKSIIKNYVLENKDCLLFFMQHMSNQQKIQNQQQDHFVQISCLSCDNQENVLRIDIIQEYIKNGNLYEFQNNFSQIFQDQSFKYETIKQIAQNIEKLHQNSMVHENLKPNCILIDDNLKPKICYFSLINNIQQIDIRFSSYELIQKIQKEEVTLGSQTDIWSLGCIIYFVYTGKLPWPFYQNHDQIMINMKLQRHFLNDQQDEIEQIPEQIFQIIKKCLNFDQFQRPNIQTILKNLEDYQQYQ